MGKKRKIVKYVGYYDTNESMENRECFLSATNFMDYISDCIVDCGYTVEYISMSQTNSNRIVWGSKKKIKNNIYLKKFLSFGRINRLISRFDIHFLRLQMFLYLLFCTGKNDTVVVYHSLNYAKLMYWLRKIHRFNLVLQICELYSDVDENSTKKQKDIELLPSKVCDAFIFTNKYLDRIINKSNKPAIIVYGKYKVNENTYQKFTDGLIHVVYAGTLDPRKGGATISANIGAFLTGKYHVHILGFGSEIQIENINSIIKSNYNTKGAVVTYDGILSGREFEELLSKCEIGLATQTPNAPFSLTSFPAKILTYMSMGLEVVSSSVKVVEESELGQNIHFYKEQTPQAIAEAIMSITPNKEKIIKLLDKMHLLFISELKDILK